MAELVRLTTRERERFRRYCRQKAEICREVAAQTRKLSFGRPGEALARKSEARARAHDMVADLLERGEQTTVKAGGGD